MANIAMVRAVCLGAFAFTTNVAANDTVLIGDKTYTFKASPAAVYDVDVGADLDTSIDNLVAAINDSVGEAATEYYGTGLDAHPEVTAIADTTNDEVDLTARMAGEAANAIYLAATSPGANDIVAAGVTLKAAIAASAGTNGSGNMDAFIVDLLDRNQVNSELQAALKLLTDAAD
jgi:hypothetical protein